jgi:hypothetical protein
MPQHRTIAATLVPNHDGSPCVVEMRPLLSKDEDLACDAVGLSGIPKGSQGFRFLREQVRLTLVAVNGKPVSYNDTERYDDIFTSKQQAQLRELVNQINNPTEEEREDFLKSIEPSTTERS